MFQSHHFLLLHYIASSAAPPLLLLLLASGWSDQDDAGRPNVLGSRDHQLHQGTQDRAGEGLLMRSHWSHACRLWLHGEMQFAAHICCCCVWF
jgi:hypothetical protein